MKNIIFSIAILMASIPAFSTDIVISRQGQFPVGGTTIQRPGTFDPDTFVGWAEQDQAGQSYRCDHAFARYQIPKDVKGLPLVFVHGYGGDGVCWETTPDDRPGFATLLLAKGFPTYVLDLPGRGHASRTSSTVTVEPVADEMFWFDIWRMGIWPEWNEGIQFPKDSLSVSNFFRQMVPDLSNHQLDVPALDAMAKKLGDQILVTHSAGGFPGWIAAMRNPEIKGVASLEPGGFVFPEGEVPEPLPGLTGGLSGVPVPVEQFMELTKKPIIIYFGDYIPENNATTLGGSNWEVRLKMAREFVAAVNHHGGDATLVVLPEIGIRGNSHFLMQELNNDVIANHLTSWLNKKFAKND
ncbi:MAG: alpha/beta fold hydrolase [Bacteroides sp.]|nr:alpha/beta fold hydrolase [Bacteroides sp.]